MLYVRWGVLPQTRVYSIDNIEYVHPKATGDKSALLGKRFPAVFLSPSHSPWGIYEKGEEEIIRKK